MLYHSGIGTYIRNLLPLVIQALPHQRIYLLGNIADLRQFDWVLAKDVEIADFPWPIYSVSEQLHFVRSIPKDTTLFWSPHYNIPFLYKGKLLVTIHDVFYLAMPQNVYGLHKRYYAKVMFAAVCRKAEAIVCVSRFTANEFVRLTGNGKRKNIHYIHNGIDESWFQIKKGVNPYGKPYILYVGNVKPHKNLSALLAAFQLVQDQIPHDLVIVGKKEGFVTGDWQAISKAEGLKRRVTMTGYLDDSALQQYYTHADVFVFPSLYEGFGFPPLEAMACGCPVIVSNVASLPEVCGDAALYCDPRLPKDIAEKIQRVLSDQELKMEMIAKGRRQAAKFSWDKCAHETCAVIKELLE